MRTKFGRWLLAYHLWQSERHIDKAAQLQLGRLREKGL